MADNLFEIKAGDRLYTLDNLTLGDFSMFKKQFGLKAEDIFAEAINGEGETVQAVNLGDFDVLIALLVAVLRRERPNAAVSVLRAEIEALDITEISAPDVEPEPEPKVDAVPLADASEATESHATSGSSAKRQKKPGRQS